MLNTNQLMFGSFITPVNDPPSQAVALAETADRAGLDLVTFQDHPYLPSLHDTWTLMSYVAARTDRIQISANVLSLPLRPPAVLGRAAASLDLLSGGRFDMALGSGAAWDPIHAMGGPRRTPGEAVQALDEAIDVLRQMWDVDARGGVRVAGKHYQVQGAKRGPRPAHDIGIWLGAYGPRMLRLVGVKATGWLPSLSYLKGGWTTYDAGNRAIDEAAHAAGRDPREILRFINIGGAFAAKEDEPLAGAVRDWPKRLADLAHAHDISGFIVATDDADTLERLGTEVAPATRALLEG